MGFFSKFKNDKKDNVPPEVTAQEQSPENYEETIPEYKPPEEKEEKTKEKKKDVKVKKNIVK